MYIICCRLNSFQCDVIEGLQKEIVDRHHIKPICGINRSRLYVKIFEFMYSSDTRLLNDHFHSTFKDINTVINVTADKIKCKDKKSIYLTMKEGDERTMLNGIIEKFQNLIVSTCGDGKNIDTPNIQLFNSNKARPEYYKFDIPDSELLKTTVDMVFSIDEVLLCRYDIIDKEEDFYECVQRIKLHGEDILVPPHIDSISVTAPSSSSSFLIPTIDSESIGSPTFPISVPTRRNKSEKISNDKEETKREKRPNHFLSLKLNSLWEKVLNIQQLIINKDSSMRDCKVSEKKFHLTLGVMSLESEEEIDEARKYLHECKAIVQKYYNNTPIRITIQGLESFGTKVLFAQVYNDGENFNNLMKFSEEIRSYFTKVGLLKNETEEWKAHATLFKTSQAISMNKNNKKFPKIKKDIWSEFCDVTIGNCEIYELELCQMSSIGSDGFYSEIDKLSFMEGK